MRIARSLLAAGLILYPAVAQQPSPVREVHVAVQVRSETGDPVSDLRPRDFIVSAASNPSANPLPLEVNSPIPRKAHATPAVPTRLLLVLMTSDPAIRKSLPARLDWAWDAGWQVSVEDTNGIQTSYVSSPAQLQSVLAHAGTAHCSMPCSVRELTRFPGRRVLFLVTDKGTIIPQATLGSVLLNGVTVYHVGGDPSKQLVPYGFSWGYSPIINHPMGPLEVESSFVGAGSQYERRRGRETEDRTFKSAMQDAIADAKGYYDLKLQLPAEVNSLTLTLNVRGNSGAKCYILAEPYAEGSTPPSLTVLAPK